MGKKNGKIFLLINNIAVSFTIPHQNGYKNGYKHHPTDLQITFDTF